MLKASLFDCQTTRLEPPIKMNTFNTQYYVTVMSTALHTSCPENLYFLDLTVMHQQFNIQRSAHTVFMCFVFI